METGGMALPRSPVGSGRTPAASEVEIGALGSGGVGVGTLPDGKVVFVPRTAPGDRVMAEVVTEKPRWARAEAVAWLREGPGRRAPPCPRYDACDGCAMQHLAYAEQVAWKGRIAGEALRRLGGLEVEDPLVVPSPEEIRYRNRMTFTLRRLDGGRVVAGLRERRHPGRVLDIGPECLLPVEPLADLWGELREGWGDGACFLPAGRELRLTLREGEQGGSLLVRGGRGAGDPDSLLDRVTGLASVWREEKGSPPRHLAGEERVAVAWGDDRLSLSAAAFLQVNQNAADLLYDYVLSEVGDVGRLRVIDAYCGPGILGRAMARSGATVLGVDVQPGDQEEVRYPGGGSYRVLEGKVEETLQDLLPADVLLLNPPRAGLHGSLPGLLGKEKVERAVYVSCDPATLARDLKGMMGSYTLERVRAFDLFPQTEHMEIVASLRASRG